MPTFKNNTDSPKYYEAGGKQYYFPPKQKVEIKVIKGSVRLYAGNSRVGIVISESYNSVYQWSYAPFLSVLGLVDDISIQITVEEI